MPKNPDSPTILDIVDSIDVTKHFARALQLAAEAAIGGDEGHALTTLALNVVERLEGVSASLLAFRDREV